MMDVWTVTFEEVWFKVGVGPVLLKTPAMEDKRLRLQETFL